MTHALFGGPSSGGSSGTSRNLVEFKAGKLTLKNGWVHAIDKKGLVYVHQSDDGLMHLCWKDRSSGVVEDDLIIFPDDIEFKKVDQCSTGRVYLLRFKSSSKKFFFWMQEPNDEKDGEICRKVNDYLNNPPTPGANRTASGNASSGAGGIASALSGLGESDLSGMFGNMSQSELLQLLQMSMQMGMGQGGRPQSASSDVSEQQQPPSRVQSSPGGERTAAPTENANRPVTAIGASSQDTPRGGQSARIQLTDLQNILSSITPRGGGAAGASSTQVKFDLNDLFTSDKILPLLVDETVQQRLLPHLPDNPQMPKTVDELRSSITSPQFRQCVSAFAAAIQSGDMGPVISQFDLCPEAIVAANEGDLHKFVNAISGSSTVVSSANNNVTADQDVDMVDASAEGSEKDKKDDAMEEQ